MIDNSELMAIKERLLIASQAAQAIIRSPDTVRYDEETYWKVHMSLSKLGEDVAAVMAELDVWREMFRDRVNAFINGGLINEVRGGSDGGNAGNDVPAGPVPEPAGSGEPARADEAATDSPVPPSGVETRKTRKRRSNKRGNPEGVRDPASEVDAGTGEGSVGG